MNERAGVCGIQMEEHAEEKDNLDTNLENGVIVGVVGVAAGVVAGAVVGVCMSACATDGGAIDVIELGRGGVTGVGLRISPDPAPLADSSRRTRRDTSNHQSASTAM